MKPKNICRDFTRTRFPCGRLIDLFDFDQNNNRAEVGIVQGTDNRKQNIGSEALDY
jgi:hypothetical protein